MIDQKQLEEILIIFWNRLDAELDEVDLDEFHSGEIVKRHAKQTAKDILS